MIESREHLSNFPFQAVRPQLVVASVVHCNFAVIAEKGIWIIDLSNILQW